MADDDVGMKGQHERVHLFFALVALAAALGLVVLGVVFDAREAPLTVRLTGFVALVAWIATAVGFLYRGVEEAFEVRYLPVNAAAPHVVLLAATAATLVMTAFVLFARETARPLVAVDLSRAGQAEIARQCGTRTSPIITGHLVAGSLDDSALRIEVPRSSCPEDEEVSIRRAGVLGLTLLDSPEGRRAQEPSRVALSWTMPDRLEQDDPEVHAELDPDAWPADIDIDDPRHPRCDGARYEWTVSPKDSGAVRAFSAEEIPIVRKRGCTFGARFPREGVYRVDIVVTGPDGSVAVGSRDIVVQDWLIVSLGDSVASGEGHPAKRRPTWREGAEGCHRSVAAGPLQAALRIEAADPRTSVTFVHLACTGARIRRNANEDYIAGQALLGDESTVVSPRSQLGQLDDLIAGGAREIDALVVSVGANDIEFSQIVKTCLFRRKCDERLGAELPARFRSLASSYDRLAQALGGEEKHGLRAGRTYLTEYFDPTHDQDGRPCKIGLRGVRRITRDEATWAYTEVLLPLNAAGRRAADAYHWRYIGGIQQAFERHGYCAKERWVLTLVDAAKGTPGILGKVNPKKIIQSMRQFPFHPNDDGHREYARRIADELAHDFWPDGSADEPRHPERRF
jgi:hypothetical protein